MNTLISRLILLPLLGSGFAPAAIALRSDSPNPLRSWAFEYGLAFITDDTIDKVALEHTSIAHGPAGGQVHLLTAAYRLAEASWQVGNCQFKPLLELPLTLGIVDENGRSPFLNYSVSFQVRWRDFPWNKYVSTTTSMGAGLAYSEEIFLMDIQTHSNRFRSRVKNQLAHRGLLGLAAIPAASAHGLHHAPVRWQNARQRRHQQLRLRLSTRVLAFCAPRHRVTSERIHASRR